MQVAQRQTEAALRKTVHRNNKEQSALRKELLQAKHDRKELEIQLSALDDLEEQ